MEGDWELLERFKPRVLYDSLEAFFADCPAELTDNPGNQLLGGTGKAGTRLSLRSLGPGDDRRAERLSIKGKDYRSQYVRLIASRPELRDWVFGRVYPLDEDTKWLQYWFFYFYDDPALASHLGAHEGDWEMIQVRVRLAGTEWQADRAVYAQHNYASQLGWNAVETDPATDRPLVYSARGSHASYFAAGLYDTAAWFDVADGGGPRRELRLMMFDDATQGPPWAYWPGRWGDTEQGEGALLIRLLARIKRVRHVLQKIQSASPDAPCTHNAWKDPQAFFEKATEREALKPVSGRPQLAVTFERRGSNLRYSLHPSEDGDDAPATLVVNVSGEPPRTFTVDVRAKRRRSGTVPWLKLDPTRSYELTASVVDTDGRSSLPVPATIDVEPGKWYVRPLGAIGYLVALAIQPIWQLQAKLHELRRGAAG